MHDMTKIEGNKGLRKLCNYECINNTDLDLASNICRL